MREKDLIQVPLVSSLAMTAFQFIGVCLPKLLAPLAHCFVGQHDSSLSHDLLNIAIAEGKTEIQPETVTNNFRGKSISFIERCGWLCFHTLSMPDLLHFGELTIPFMVRSYTRE